jgi:hypothetical protein
MTKAERIEYRKGQAAKRRGEPCPVANAADGLAWAFYLGWMSV